MPYDVKVKQNISDAVLFLQMEIYLSAHTNKCTLELKYLKSFDLVLVLFGPARVWVFLLLRKNSKYMNFNTP